MSNNKINSEFSILKDEFDLEDIEEICRGKWEIKLDSKRKQKYENIICKARSKIDNILYCVILGRFSDNKNWSECLRFVYHKKISFDYDNSFVAWEKNYGTAVTNGYQFINCIEFRIQQSNPKLLKEFANRILEGDY